MKTFVKSGFFMCLVIVLVFGTLMTLSYYCNLNGARCPTGFFGVITLVFLMILPACSTVK
jgi:hypothetical protein